MGFLSRGAMRVPADLLGEDGGHGVDAGGIPLHEHVLELAVHVLNLLAHLLHIRWVFCKCLRSYNTGANVKRINIIIYIDGQSGSSS